MPLTFATSTVLTNQSTRYTATILQNVVLFIGGSESHSTITQYTRSAYSDHLLKQRNECGLNAFSIYKVTPITHGSLVFAAVVIRDTNVEAQYKRSSDFSRVFQWVPVI